MSDTKGCTWIEGVFADEPRSEAPTDDSKAVA